MPTVKPYPPNIVWLTRCWNVTNLALAFFSIGETTMHIRVDTTLAHPVVLFPMPRMPWRDSYVSAPHSTMVAVDNAWKSFMPELHMIRLVYPWTRPKLL